jgi:hypothetical protein
MKVTLAMEGFKNGIYRSCYLYEISQKGVKSCHPKTTTGYGKTDVSFRPKYVIL